MALRCLMVRAEPYQLLAWPGSRQAIQTQETRIRSQHFTQLSHRLWRAAVLQHRTEQTKINSKRDSHVCSRLFQSAAAIPLHEGGLTWAQLCLIMVSRGVSSALTSRRASASSSWRPKLSVGVKVLPNAWIDSMVLETASASFGDVATSTDG